jgi:uncharacterized protein (TIGR02246 family)
MRNRIVALAFLTSFLVAACAPAPAPSAPAVDTAAEEQAIRTISSAWLASEQAKDAAGVLTHFAADASVAWSGDEPATGHDAIRALLEKGWAEDPSAMVTWSTDSVHVSAAGDMAVETGSWSTTGTGPDGSGSDAGKYLTYYRKVDGAWKVAADVSSSGPRQQ